MAAILEGDSKLPTPTDTLGISIGHNFCNLCPIHILLLRTYVWN